MSDLTGKVRKLLMEELNVEVISDGAKREDFAEWDSLTYLRIIAALENTFGIEVTPENINNFYSLENIVHEIEKHRNNHR